MSATRINRMMHPVNRRASVLIFAVVVLAILAMLSTAFLIVARHAIASAKPGINNTQADGAADAAVVRANHLLRTATHRDNSTTPPIISTPDAVVSYGTESGALIGNAVGPCIQLLKYNEDWIDPITGTKSGKVGDAAHRTADFVTPVTFFERDATFEIANQIKNPSFAVISTAFPHYLDPAHPSVANILNTPHYTISPLRLSAQLVGDADRANPYYVRSSLSEFYNADVKISATLQKYRAVSNNVGTIRGRHFVWVRDLDACFYAIPAMWGLRAPSNISTVYTPDEQKIALGILEYLRHTPDSAMMSNPLIGDSPDDVWKSTDMTNVSLLAPYDYPHIGDVALELEALRPPTASYPYPTWRQDALSTPSSWANTNSYPFWRADLEMYFTTTLDTTRNFKPHPTAININTAPEEIIQAMFSQIPCWDPVAKVEKTFATYFPAAVAPNASTAKHCLAELLAKRIVAKRPFLSRMDFEDFAASLLPDDPSATPYQISSTGVVSGTTGTNVNYPLGLVMSALSKRIDGEISLGQYMDMPGLPNGDYVNSAGAVVDVNPYKGFNTRQGMINRFTYFIDDTSVLTAAVQPVPTRAQCSLTVKAFNNLLNSVSRSPAINVFSVTQAIPAGSSGAAYAPEILPVSSVTSIPVFTSIQLGGDDTYIYDTSNPPKITGISTGPNGIAETQISGYSYYSHDYAPQEYKPIRYMTTNSAFDAPYCLNPVNVGKFVYGINPASTPPLAPQAIGAVTYNNYAIADLAKWSCIGEGTLSGYYDMWFNVYDKMELELGEKSPGISGTPKTPKPTDPSISMLPGAPANTSLLTAVTTPVAPAVPTDFQIQPTATTPGSAFVGDPILVIPGPTGVLTTAPGGQAGVITASTDDRIVPAIRLARLPANQTSVYSQGSGDLQYIDLRPAPDGFTYIYPSKANNFVLKTTLGSPKVSGDFDVLVYVIVDGGDMVCNTNTLSDDVIAATPPLTANDVQVGNNLVNDTFVWGPMRASQRQADQLLASAADQKPSAGATSITVGTTTTITPSTLNAYYKGDVAWSPPICFRSRFFGTYVLAEGVITQPVSRGNCTAIVGSPNQVIFKPFPDYPNAVLPSLDTTNATKIVPGTYFAVNSVPVGTTNAPTVQHVYMVESYIGSTITFSSPIVGTINSADQCAGYTSKKIGERRTESIYDAFTDTVLWTRSPLTDKRTLGDQ